MTNSKPRSFVSFLILRRSLIELRKPRFWLEYTAMVVVFAGAFWGTAYLLADVSGIVRYIVAVIVALVCGLAAQYAAYRLSFRSEED